MLNKTGDKYLLFSEYKAAILIWKTIPPVLIIFGTIGNTLTVVVLTRKSIRNSTTALYLTFLTLSDLIVLHIGLLRRWLIHLFDFDVRQISEATCKIHTLLVYTFLDFSAWILIAVTLERIIVVWYPYKTRNRCSRKNATILIITIFILVFGLNSHFLYGVISDVTDNGDELKCVFIDNSYSVFIESVWSWIDLCVFCLIPFSVIVVGNSLILYKTLNRRRKAKPKTITSNRNKDQRQSSMTKILVTLNTVFLLTTLPISVFNIGHAEWSSTGNQQTKARLQLWWAIVNMLMYTNNAFNFLLYSMSGSHFRREFKRTFCQKCASNDTNPHSVILRVAQDNDIICQ